MPRPGVFVTESVLPVPVPDSPPSAAAGALLAELPAGPATPTVVNSWYSFIRIFGPLNRNFPASFAANQFFRSGGRELFVCRLVKDDAAAASASILGDGDDEGSVADEVYITFAAKSVGTYGNNLRVSLTQNASGLYDLVVLQESGASGPADDVRLETFFNLNLAQHGNQELADIINVQSRFINVTWGNDSTVALPGSIPLLTLAGGLDGTDSGEVSYSTPLAALKQTNRPFVIFSPGVVDSSTVAAIVDFAEETGSFAVLDTEPGLTAAQAVTYAASLPSTSHAAVYYPHIWVADPTSPSRDSIIRVAPSGSVAGAILGTDASSGVYKSPAGLQTIIPGVLAIETSLTNEDLDALNNDSKPVNALRSIPGSGVVVMGARTLDQSASTRYINIRRTMVFLAKEMQARTEFALFRNNDPDLWDEIRTVLDSFLLGFMTAGGLRGDSPSDAYFVKVDAENNSASDIAAGRVNIEVGVALQYPAEFILINLTQQTIS